MGSVGPEDLFAKATASSGTFRRGETPPSGITVRLRVRCAGEVRAIVERRARLPAPNILISMARADDLNGNALDEAADPSTSPWRLAELADEADPDVRMAVAANPSASLLTVMRLRRDVDPRVRVVLSARDGIVA